LDGRATPSSCLVAAVVTVTLAVLPSPSQPWLPSRKRRPHRRGSARLGGPPCGRGDRGCPNAFRAVRPFPVRVASGSPGRAGWSGRCPAGSTGQAVSGSLSDRGVHRGRRTRPRGHRTGPGLRTFRHRAWVQVATTDGSRCWSRLGLAEGSMRKAVLSGQGQDVDTAWLAVAGWPEAWSDAGRWRCPPLGRRRPDRVRTRRLGGHIELGVSGRPDAREVRMSVAWPAAAGCPQEELIGGDGVQVGVRRPHLAEVGAQTDCRHVRNAMARSSRWPPGGPGLGAPTSGFSAEACLRHQSGRRTRVEAGGSVGIGKELPSVGAGGPAGGSARRRVVPGGADRLAAAESLGMSCSGRASIKNSKDASR
jgi:hypothetical protein